MYGYQGQYGQPPGVPGYGGYPGAPPGMAPPPGTAGAPGFSSPGGAPGPPQSNANLPGRPGGIPPNFQPPANFANINFNAPVIRLGTMGPGKDGVAGGQGGMMSDGMSRRGLGMDGRMDQRPRENLALVAPTREEVMRTIFIGKIPPTMLDVDLESIFRCAGRLRKWIRAFDADNKPCTFGFAEYEDAESLENAIQTLPEIEVPATHLDAKAENSDESTPVERVRLLVQIDDASRRYADEWAEKRGEDEAATAARIHQANEALAEVLADIFNPNRVSRDFDGDLAMQGSEIKADPLTGEIITIPLSGEDELSDIPAEMRETVAAEIAAFRQRSNERDMDRLRREKEIEVAEKRNGRVNRLSSPPRSAPTGPAAANGIPLGPRGAPSGPKGYQGGQNGINGAATAGFSYVTPEEENSDASDDELERRRKEKKEAEQEKLYLDLERKWLNRERSRTAAVEREKTRDQVESGTHEKEKDTMARRLREFSDDSESFRRSEDFYRDRTSWVRNRQAFLKRERKADEEDRAQEAREKAKDVEKLDRNRASHDLSSSMEPQTDDFRTSTRDQPRFKISLGAAAQRAQAAAPRRTVADVEGLLEDEEEEAPTAKRTLIPIKYDTAAEAAGLTEEERQQAVRQLAAEIPTTKEGLWSWDLKWEFVDDSVLQEQIRPFVEKKMMEYLGVLEEMLVDVVEEHLKKRGSPEELIKELEGPLDEEAEVLVMKLWRVLIFCSESEKRGLSN